MSIIGYVRVSSKEQNTDNQLLAMTNAGFQPDKIFSDHGISGQVNGQDRAGFAGCLNYLRDQDTLVVFAIDRLGRSTIDVLRNIQLLQHKGVRLVVIQQGFDTSSPAGKLALTMFSAFAEFENTLRRDRQMLGIQRAKKENRLTGRPRKITDDDVLKAKDLISKGIPKAQVARELRMDRSSLYRLIK